MDSRTKTEIEALLKRLDIVKIDLITIKDRQHTILDGMWQTAPCGDEVMDQDSLVECLYDAINYFEKTLECLSEATHY